MERLARSAMKLHEDEAIERTSAGEWASWRTAVPGGWMYVYRMPDVYSVTSCFVPDRTAEHVTHGAVNVAAMAGAEAGYTKAVADCWQVANEWAKGFGAPMLERARLIDALKALRFDGSTSQTREG